MLYNSIGVLYNIDVYSLVLRVNGEWSVLNVNIKVFERVLLVVLSEES